MIYADTSFLFALYQEDDTFHVAADRLMARVLQPLAFTLLGEFELLNNVHRALALKNIDQSVHDAILRRIAEDEANGILLRRALTDAELYARARSFSQRFAHEISARSLVILHVAAAEILRVAHFVSYDVKQRSLAQKVGLSLLPRTLSTK